jgi:hypothetical protein
MALFLRKHWQLLLVIAVFILSRIFIYLNPPKYYSDVKADYERYANMWRYGLTPYRKHLYEYPPATVPLLSWPLDLDQAGIGKYYSNYRAEVAIIDVLFFSILLATMMNKLPWMKTYWFSSALVYIGFTALGHDFFYDGIDLAFTSATMLSFFAFVWFKKPDSWIGQIFSWGFFWLSTAIKFLTIPLAAPLFLLFHGSLTKRMSSAFIGFLIVWIIPILLYGRSLSVSFVYNFGRPIKYAAFPAYVIQVINAFTHTEVQRHMVPDFEYVGPVSNIITRVDSIVFPICVALVILLSAFSIYRKYLKGKWGSLEKVWQTFLTPPELDNPNRMRLLLATYGTYVFTLFLTAKTFSQPFHIWYMPLIVIYPYKTSRMRWFAFGLATLMILMDMTPYLEGPSKYGLIRDVFRFIPMGILLAMFIRDLWTGNIFASALTKRSGKVPS